MATHKSAEKRARQSIRRTSRNVKVKSRVKTAEKNLVAAIQAKTADAGKVLSEYTKKIMAAVSKGVVKKTTASRKISRLSTRLSK